MGGVQAVYKRYDPDVPFLLLHDCISASGEEERFISTIILLAIKIIK